MSAHSSALRRLLNRAQPLAVEIRRESWPIEILHASFDGVGKKVGAIWISCYAHFASFMHLHFTSMLAT